MPEQPLNILWIQTDEQRCDSLGCYGNARMRTPVLDALAARGTLFSNHHVQSPVCVPSRVCELTGRYPHQTGIFNNTVHYTWGRWPEGVVSFPELFARAGYVTCNLGKFHTPEHATWGQNWHFEMFPDEASHMRMGKAYPDFEYEVLHLDAEGKSVILSGRYPDVQGGRTPQIYLVDHAVDWLGNYSHVRRPFLLRVSFLAPHTPVLAPEPFYSLYDPAEMDWDVPTDETLSGLPEYELRKGGLEYYRWHSDANYRRMRATYYGLVAHVDAEVGRLLAALDRFGLTEKTLVVFTSDHGDLMGEYGQFQKGMFYDLTTRVPLIMSGPGVPAGVVNRGLTEQVDLGPTLLRTAGLKVPAEMVGRDLLFPAQPREDVIGEIATARAAQDPFLMPSQQNGYLRRAWIRTARWSLDYTSEIDGCPTANAAERDGKLIDLQNDPLAHRNLYHEPGCRGVIDELQARFEARTREGRRPVQIGRQPTW